MNNTQMLAALAALPDPELLQAGKITDPIGANTFYSARTVVKMLEDAKKAEREACAKVCDGLSGQGYCDGPGPKSCAAAIRMRSNAEFTGAASSRPVE